MVSTFGDHDTDFCRFLALPWHSAEWTLVAWCESPTLCLQGRAFTLFHDGLWVQNPLGTRQRQSAQRGKRRRHGRGLFRAQQGWYAECYLARRWANCQSWIFVPCLSGIQSCFCQGPLFSFGIHFFPILSRMAQMGFLFWGGSWFKA